MTKTVTAKIYRWVAWALAGCITLMALGGCQLQLKVASARVPELVLSSLTDP